MKNTILFGEKPCQISRSITASRVTADCYFVQTKAFYHSRSATQILHPYPQEFEKAKLEVNRAKSIRCVGKYHLSFQLLELNLTF